MNRPAVQIVGLGRVGLPLAVRFAEEGCDVRGVDASEAVRGAIGAGVAPFREPGLDERLAAVVRAGRLTVAAALAPSRVTVVAVPTPLGADRRADLSALDDVVGALVGVVRDDDLVVVESTCPPGTTERVAVALRRVARVLVATATERVLPGRVFEELSAVARVVGGVDEASTARAVASYRPVSPAGVRGTDARTAEVVKLVENAYRDVNVAFANEVDTLCRAHGVASAAVIGLANEHPRVAVARPGPGVGGHCLPVDPWFLLQDAAEGGELIRTARAVNDARVAQSAARVLERAPEGARIALLGVTYKADTDDLRGSPALAVAERVRAERPGRVRCADPWSVGRPDSPEWVEGDAAAVLAGADLAVALVPHAAFRDLATGRAERLDLCGLWDIPEGSR